MAVGNIYRVRVLSTAGQQIGLNVLHYRHATSVGADFSYGAFLSRWGTVFSADYKDCLSEQATFRGVSIQRINPAPPDNPVSAINNIGVGNILGDMLPKQVSGIITLRTNKAGRRYRGRVYIPFPGENASDVQGQPNAGYMVSLGKLASSLPLTFTVTEGGGATVNEFKLCIYHRDLGTSDDVATAISRDRWANQHRRGDWGATNLPPF